MNADEMKRIVLDLKTRMDPLSRHFESFASHGVQVESWLKGELLCFLDEQKARGRIASFDREVLTSVGRRRVDFAINFPAESPGSMIRVWIEAKHWLVGLQKGVKYDASFYFKDPTSIGIRNDVAKLVGLSGDKYVLILATANPGSESWSDGIKDFNNRCHPLVISSLTAPADFPPSYFLGLLQATFVGKPGRRV